MIPLNDSFPNTSPAAYCSENERSPRWSRVAPWPTSGDKHPRIFLGKGADQFCKLLTVRGMFQLWLFETLNENVYRTVSWHSIDLKVIICVWNVGNYHVFKTIWPNGIIFHLHLDFPWNGRGPISLPKLATFWGPRDPCQGRTHFGLRNTHRFSPLLWAHQHVFLYLICGDGHPNEPKSPIFLDVEMMVDGRNPCFFFIQDENKKIPYPQKCRQVGLLGWVRVVNNFQHDTWNLT